MNYDLFIFDLDGTLVDTRLDIAKSINEMLNYCNIEEKSVTEITSLVGDGIKKLVERSVYGQEVDIEEALNIFNESYSNHLLDSTKAYPGVYEMLERLNKKKAILTNKSFCFTKKIIDKLDLTYHFSVIVSGDTMQTKKPEPDGINYILGTTDTNSKRALMIGDGKNDILAAKVVHIPSVYVTYGYSDIAKLDGLKPDYIIDKPIKVLGFS